MPQYLDRLHNRLEAKGLSIQDIESALAGTQKHGRQRTRAKPRHIRKTKARAKTAKRKQKRKQAKQRKAREKS